MFPIANVVFWRGSDFHDVFYSFDYEDNSKLGIFSTIKVSTKFFGRFYQKRL